MKKTIPLPDELKKYLLPALERKVVSVKAIDVRELTSYTDVLIIIEGASRRQVKSIAEHLIKTLKKQHIKVLGSEGVKEGEWALLDYGHVIVHVFESEAKSFYDLEGFWSDALPMDLSEFETLFDSKEMNDDV